jgi:glyoxylase-like metal-dependent hydrolase (beta-lactamase superfamily II)
LIKKIVVGSIDTNCYLIWDKDGLAAIIDPAEESSLITEKISELNLDVRKILVTHGHWDHIGAVKSFSYKYDVKVYLHNDDREALPEDINVETVKDGDKISVGRNVFEIIHTPGHTPGSLCIKSGDNLFAGDTLFNGSVGRTDLPGGSTKELMRSLDKLIKLPDKVVVYPGHGAITTMESEKKINPYLVHRIKSANVR